jgi:hypothetical protein
MCTTTILAIMGCVSVWHSTLASESYQGDHAVLDSSILGLLLPIFICPLSVVAYILFSYAKAKVCYSQIEYMVIFTFTCFPAPSVRHGQTTLCSNN